MSQYIIAIDDRTWKGKKDNHYSSGVHVHTTAKQVSKQAYMYQLPFVINTLIPFSVQST